MPTAKEKLLRAAVEVFSEKGYSGASTREIARRARVNPVTLFRTFNSKEKLHAAAVSYVMDRIAIRKQIDRLAQRERHASRFIAGVMKTLVETMLGMPEFQRLIMFSALEKSDVAFDAVWNRLMPIFENVRGHISRFVAKGELRKKDPLVITRLIFAAAVFHYQLYELYGGKDVPEFSPVDLSDRYAEILSNGLIP